MFFIIALTSVLLKTIFLQI